MNLPHVPAAAAPVAVFILCPVYSPVQCSPVQPSATNPSKDKQYYSLQITCAREALNAVHRKIRMKIVVIFSYLFLSFRREMYRLARSFAPEPN